MYSAQHRKDLAWVVRTAEGIVGGRLPDLDSVHTGRVQRKARSVATDPSHPSNTLFVALRSGRRDRTIKATATRLSFSVFSPELSKPTHHPRPHAHNDSCPPRPPPPQHLLSPPLNAFFISSGPVFYLHASCRCPHTLSVLFHCVFFFFYRPECLILSIFIIVCVCLCSVCF